MPNRIRGLLRRTALRAALAIGLGLATSCAPRAQPSGFLEDYRGFQAAPGWSGALIYRSGERPLAPYRAILLEPVSIWTKADAEYRGVDPEELAELGRYFREAALEALGGSDYSIVEEPGPGVLRVRAAITDVVPTRPLLNTATMAGPGRAVSTATRVITGTHLFVGEVSIEAEILDSQSGERLVAIVDRSAGSKFNPIAGATTWGNAKRALQSWAQQFRERLDASRRP